MLEHGEEVFVIGFSDVVKGFDLDVFGCLLQELFGCFGVKGFFKDGPGIFQSPFCDHLLGQAHLVKTVQGILCIFHRYIAQFGYFNGELFDIVW